MEKDIAVAALTQGPAAAYGGDGGRGRALAATAGARGQDELRPAE